MIIYRKVPLSWLILTANKRRLFTSLSGICVAVILMFMQLGFQSALFTSAVELASRFDADLVMVHRKRMSLINKQEFSRRFLFKTFAIEGVETANPLYIRRLDWKNPETDKINYIRVIGLDPKKNILDIPGIHKYQDELFMPNTVLIDTKSKSNYYGVPKIGMPAELARRSIDVVGTFSLGTDFVFAGSIIMSELNYAKFSPSGNNYNSDLVEKNIGILSKVDVGLIKTNPGSDLINIKEAIRKIVPENIVLLTKEEFVKREKDYWDRRTPIGIVFSMGTAIGFLVGVIICYQILYTDVVDNITQFATLKAIGYNSKFIVMVVIREALFLSILGFIPSFLLSRLFYKILAGITGLPLQLSMNQICLIFFLTLGMCILSSIIAILKVIKADPAEVF